MKLLEKRVVIPSALICFLAIAYFAFKLFLSGSYVRSCVIESLADKFNCNLAVDSATLGRDHLIIRGFTLSYRKSRQVHHVARIGKIIVHFRPHPFFKTGAFDSVQIEDAVVTVARDSEGWVTIGRIISPGARFAAKAFDVDVRYLQLNVGEKSLPIESATLKVTTAWPKVTAQIADATVLNGAATGKVWFTIEEDAMMGAEIQAGRIDLAEVTRTANTGDLALAGQAACTLRLEGRASSPAWVRKGSSLAVDGLAVGLRGGQSVFQAKKVALVMYQDESPREGLALKARLADSFLNVAPWVQLCDTPRDLLMRQRVEELFRGSPYFHMRLDGTSLRLIYKNLILPLDRCLGTVQHYGEPVIFRDIIADMAGGKVEAYWKHRGTDTAPRYDGQATVSGVSVAQLIRNSSLRGRNIDGTLSGAVEFSTTASASGGIEGKGNLQIRNATLWALPILEQVQRAAKLAGRTDGRNPILTAQLALDKDWVRLDPIHLRDGSVEITGNGEIYHSGEVDLHLQVTSKEALQKNVPVIDDVVGIFSDAFSRKVQAIRVTGTCLSPSAAPTDRPVVRRDKPPK